MFNHNTNVLLHRVILAEVLVELDYKLQNKTYTQGDIKKVVDKINNQFYLRGLNFECVSEWEEIDGCFYLDFYVIQRRTREQKILHRILVRGV
jgi:hypothetical protein